MDRIIPSFRILIGIEKLEWLSFRQHLNNKEDRKMFDKLFSIPKLYCHCLSHLSKPSIIESIILILFFYNFKALRTIIKASSTKIIRNIDNNIKQKNTESSYKGITHHHQQQQILIKSKKDDDDDKDATNNIKIIEDWKKFVDCLNNNDKKTFISMKLL